MTCCSRMDSGLERCHSANTSNISTSESTLSTIDFGIVDARSNHRICVPVGRVGIENTDSVASIEVSCDCVQVTFNRFLHRDGKWQEAMCFEVLADSSTIHADLPAVDLAVKIVVYLKASPQLNIELRFLHTTVVPIEMLSSTQNVNQRP